MENLPFKSIINENTLIVTYGEYKVKKTISIPKVLKNSRDGVFENETLKSAKQLNIMMFGKENYTSSVDIPIQLRNDNGSSYALYFKRPISGEIQKYNIKYVTGTSSGIEFIKEDGKRDVNYGQLIFIEPLKINSNTMKLEANLGDELKHAKVNIPKIVPVTKNFDPTKIIGEAEVKMRGNNMVADIKIVNQKELEKIKRTLEVSLKKIQSSIKNKKIN